MNDLRLCSSSSISCKSVAQWLTNTAQFRATWLSKPRIIIFPHSFCSLLFYIQPLPNPVSSAISITYLQTPAPTFHGEDAHQKQARQISKSSQNKGSPFSCQTSPPVCLLCEFGFYGTSRSIVFWVHITPGRSCCALLALRLTGMGWCCQC